MESVYFVNYVHHLQDIKEEKNIINNSSASIQNTSESGIKLGKDISMHTLCRMCANPYKDYVNLYVKCENRRSLAHVMQDNLGVIAAEGDGLPSVICLSCLDKLERCEKLRVDVNRIQQLLLQLYHSSVKNVSLTPPPSEVILPKPASPAFSAEYVITEEVSEQKELTRKRPGLRTLKTTSVTKKCKFPSATDSSDSSDTSYSDKNHKSIHSQKSKHSKHICRKCNKQFKSAVSVKNHICKVEKSKSFKCSKCSKVFSCNSLLKRHEVIHEPKSSRLVAEFQCNHCQKVYQHAQSLERHLQSITGKQLYKCGSCSSVYKRKESLQMHVFSKHALNKQTVADLNKGEKRVEDIPKECFKIYKTTSKGLLLHVCPFCPKVFSHKSHFNDHLLLHKGERNYQCNKCPKSYFRKTHLNNHMLTHLKEKPFNCHHCSKNFHRKYHIKVHMLQHIVYRPYKCTECDKTFGRKQHLDSHLQHHYYCDICSLMIPHKKTLECHIKKHLIIK